MGGRGLPRPRSRRNANNGNPDSDATLGRCQARGGDAKAKRHQAKRLEHPRVRPPYHRVRIGLGAVGAVAIAGDALKRNARTYTDSGGLTKQLDRFERRGLRVLDRGGRAVKRRTR